MSFITFNEKSSKDFFMSLENGITFESPSRRSQFETVLGMDGEVDIGDGMLSNATKSFPFRLRLPSGQKIDQVSTDISNWLKQDNLWHDLYFDGEPDYIYQAKYHEEYSIERVVSWYGKAVLKFTVKPYKFLKSGLTEITLPSTITNPTIRDARPKLAIQGTGNITISFGDSVLSLKNVDGGVIVDSLAQMITSLDGNRPAWDKMTSYPFPVIKPGKQAILTTGTITSVKIIPRFEVIV